MPLTKQTSIALLEHVLTNIFKIPPPTDSNAIVPPLQAALSEEGIYGIHDLMSLTSDMIADLQYPTLDSKGKSTTRPVPTGYG